MRPSQEAYGPGCEGGLGPAACGEGSLDWTGRGPWAGLQPCAPTPARNDAGRRLWAGAGPLDHPWAPREGHVWL